MRISNSILIAVVTLSGLVAGQAPPPPGGGGPINTNPPPVYVPGPPVIPAHGVIHTTTTNTIEWYNFNSHVFTVEYRTSLMDGSWTNLGEGHTSFQHDNPEGFYRALDNIHDAVFPVINAGTSNLYWTASTTSAYAVVECLNTNIPPEWGEGYLIVRTEAPSGTEIIVDVVAGSQTGQVTVVVK